MKVESDDELHWNPAPACGRCSVDGCDASATGYFAARPNGPDKIALCESHRVDVRRIWDERQSRSS